MDPTQQMLAALGNAPGPRRQGEIYLQGMLAGKKSEIPTSFEALEAKARAAMSPEAFAYVAGSAGAESTTRENANALGRWRISPRMLRDVSRRDHSVELFGRKLPAPLLVGPIGVQELVHPDADLATARACASVGVPLVISNQASFSMEKIAAQMGEQPRWFQLYWGKSDELVASLVRRAAACGCEALVVTLDTPLLGWRTRDLDLAYLPFVIGKGIAQYTSDPVFRAMLGKPPEEDSRAASLLFLATYSNAALTWNRLAWLRGQTSLPILLKGINRPDDAALAFAHGMDGIIVSNHGGRQVDGAVGSLDALDAVVKEVGGKGPVLFDSGVRGGADVFKALALGASAVLLGRPYVYGLAIAGEEGVRTVIRNLLADFDLTMALAGSASVAEITRDALVRVTA
jgi:lactate 2-monooxygenase